MLTGNTTKEETNHSKHIIFLVKKYASKMEHDNTIYKMSLLTVKSMHLNSEVRCVSNFCRQSCNGMSTLFVINMWSKGMHQFVSDGHVHNVCWSQLELKCIHVDVTQHEPHKAVLRIVSILNSCR